MMSLHRFPLRRVALGAAALLCAASPATARVAHAQGAQGGGCTNCRRPEPTEAEQRRIAQVRRDLERAVERARMRIDELRETSEFRTSEAVAMRRAKIALERAEPATREFALQLAALQALAAEEEPRFFEDPEFKGALKDVSRLHGELILRQFRGPRRGYLGVSLSSAGRVEPNGRVTLTVDEYPSILSVDTDSPAFVAGVRSGDVLLALNGRDVVRQGPIALSDLLMPGETLRVRVRRGRETKELPVRVGQHQETVVYFATPGAVVPPNPPGAPGAPPGMYGPAVQTRVSTPRPPAAPVAPGEVHVVPRQAGEASATSRWIISGGEGLTFFGSSILGAEMQTMDRDQRDALDVDQGVLVLRVHEGSLAAQADLRSLDVVQRIDGERVRSPDDLRSAVQRARMNGADSVVVTVVTKRKERRVTLRW